MASERPHQRQPLAASLFVFMSSHSLTSLISSCLTGHVPVSGTLRWLFPLPGALPSSLHKVGSLRVSFRCQCHLLGSELPLSPKNTSTSCPRPVTLNPLTRLYFLQSSWVFLTLHNMFICEFGYCLSYKVNSTGAKTFLSCTYGTLYLWYLEKVPEKGGIQ